MSEDNDYKEQTNFYFFFLYTVFQGVVWTAFHVVRIKLHERG